MTIAEARTAVTEAAAVLGVKGTLEVLVTHAEELLDQAGQTDDILARARAATDHRALVMLKDKVTS